MALRVWGVGGWGGHPISLACRTSDAAGSCALALCALSVIATDDGTCRRHGPWLPSPSAVRTLMISGSVASPRAADAMADG